MPFSWLLAILGLPWPIDAPCCSVMSSSPGVLLLHLYLNILLLLRLPVLLGQGPTLLQFDLLLTNDICNDPNFQMRSRSEVPGS